MLRTILLISCLIVNQCRSQTDDLDRQVQDLVDELFPKPNSTSDINLEPSQNNNNNNNNNDNDNNNNDNNNNRNNENTNNNNRNNNDDGDDGTNSDCVCVPYYLCNNGTVIQDGVGIIDIRIGDNPCSSYLENCCSKKDRVEKPIVPTPKPIQEGARCGRRNPDGVGFRITGNKDNEAQFGEFPWMAAILREEELQGQISKLSVYQCGGALIHPRVVLTAAHCVTDKKKKFKVRLGEWDTQTKKELYPYQDRMVEKVIIHPDFYAGALFNDVALLILESEVELAENVDLICLPKQGEKVDVAKCFASGWGKDVFGKEGRYQVILKKIDLPIVPRDKCQSSLRTTRLGKYFNLHESFVCAGGEAGKDTCKGDGGSPLVCPIDGHPDVYQQLGMVAWGIGCGENQIPGVYVNVALFRDWIDQQMAYNNLDKKVYNFN